MIKQFRPGPGHLSESPREPVKGHTRRELLDEVDKARKGESMPVTFLRRTRHWHEGAIIGSKAFVHEMACRFDYPERVNNKRFSRGELVEGGALYCFRQLKPLICANQH